MIGNYKNKHFSFSESHLSLLHKDAKNSRQSAYASGTTKNLHTQWKTFLMFCTFFEIISIPVSLHNLCLYAQFLSRTFKSVASIKNYINGVRILHLFLDIEFPDLKKFEIKLLLRGIARSNPHLPKRALAITPDILARIHSFLNLSNPNEASFWSLFLTAFFMMARKSNLVPNGIKDFDPKKHLTRQDIKIQNNALLITLKWSKTIQFGERLLQIILVAIPDHPLCPVSAYKNMCTLVKCNPMSPAFCRFKKGKVIPIIYSEFQKSIKIYLNMIGEKADLYSSHSFRRGGASFAFKAGVPSELIQLQGDWSSDAYKLYLQYSDEDKTRVTHLMTKHIIDKM